MRMDVTFQESNHRFDADFGEVHNIQGADGKDGLSAYEIALKNGFEGTEQEWLESLKGSKGDKGDPGTAGTDGTDGKDGADGYTPVKGIDYFDGKDGSPGAPGNDGSNGVSCTHSWNGTTLIVTSASGTSSANLKGDKGDNGYAPVKGTDYWTDTDKQEIVDAVLVALPVAEGGSF